jgi:hypothetical protein
MSKNKAGPEAGSILHQLLVDADDRLAVASQCVAMAATLQCHHGADGWISLKDLGPHVSEIVRMTIAALLHTFEENAVDRPITPHNLM